MFFILMRSGQLDESSRTFRIYHTCLVKMLLDIRDDMSLIGSLPSILPHSSSFISADLLRWWKVLERNSKHF